MSDQIQLGADAWQLPLAREGSINAYLLGDLLVDTGGRMQVRKVAAALAGRRVVAHAVTHAHYDHAGGSHAICERFGIPFWCGAGDREALETGNVDSIVRRPGSFAAWLCRVLAGPPHPVARVLRDGDDVGAGFVALETPGHTPGSLSFWREADRLLIVGDAAMNWSPPVRRGLREPFTWATVDPAANRAGLRRLAALEPALVCFGHGLPVSGPDRFLPFVGGLNLR